MKQVLETVRVNGSNVDFQHLVKALDAYLAIVDGEEHAFFDQFNKISQLQYVVVLYADNKPVACGAIRPLGEKMEVKRMYTSPDFRGKGLALRVLHELEKWAKELGAGACILETGIKQLEAVSLYQKGGYTVIPNYPPYTQAENSVCFQKEL